MSTFRHGSSSDTRVLDDVADCFLFLTLARAMVKDRALYRLLFDAGPGGPPALIARRPATRAADH